MDNFNKILEASLSTVQMASLNHPSMAARTERYQQTPRGDGQDPQASGSNLTQQQSGQGPRFLEVLRLDSRLAGLRRLLEVVQLNSRPVEVYYTLKVVRPGSKSPVLPNPG
jgi:hypothetical protein